MKDKIFLVELVEVRVDYPSEIYSCEPTNTTPDWEDLTVSSWLHWTREASLVKLRGKGTEYDSYRYLTTKRNTEIH